MSHSGYQRTGFDGTARGVDGSIPRFHLAEVQDPNATAREGRPIFRMEERVEIIMPGIAHLTKPVHRVSQEDIDRWPDQYARFKAGQEMAREGTPLEQWPILNRAMVLELKALDIFTVEECAGLSDQAIQRIKMYGYQLREKARAYLDDGQRMALTETLSRDKEQLLSQVAELSTKVDELSALLNQTHSQLVTLQNQPNPIATYRTPEAENGPVQAIQQEAPAESALAGMLAPAPAKRGPGRPKKVQAA
jgi:hypothetical protein